MQAELTIIYYDGVCGLCNKAVQFILQRDKKRVFKFAALQSDYAIKHIGLEANLDSIVLVHKGQIYKRSNAALKIFMLLGGICKLAAIGYLIPQFLRNQVYDYIARKRYLWFKPLDACQIPDQKVRDLFLDQG